MLAQNFIAILALALTVSASPLVIRQIFDDDTFGDIFDFSSNGDGEGNQEIVNEGQNSSNNVVNSGDVGGDFTVNQSIKTCGNSQINCCNQVEKKGDTINAGLLGSVFGSGDIGVQCSPINVAVLGAQVPVNKNCAGTVACCQGDTKQNGLVNIGCTAIASLL